MKNSIDACLEFSYQGESFSPTVSIDLDKMMQLSGELPDLHRYIAKENNIDTYSYLYEVMESHEIIFNNPQGLAIKCFEEGRFDIKAFEQMWSEQQEMNILREIAKAHLGIEELGENDPIKAALLAAYQAGQAGR